MKQFLICIPDVFKSNYHLTRPIENTKEIVPLIKSILLRHPDATIWPVFNNADVEELLGMNVHLASVLRHVELTDEVFAIRYNGQKFAVDEITRNGNIRGYWNISSGGQTIIIDPNYIFCFVATNSKP